MNIISFIKKLIQVNNFAKENLEKIEDDIKNTKVLTEREWLLNRLKEKLQIQ